MASTARVIHQGDLLQALSRGFTDVRGLDDFPKSLIPKLDPTGRLLVSLEYPHNDTADFRVVGMAKLTGTMEPQLVRFTLPARWYRIIQSVQVDA